jgi:hypothetical protein
MIQQNCVDLPQGCREYAQSPTDPASIEQLRHWAWSWPMQPIGQSGMRTIPATLTWPAASSRSKASGPNPRRAEPVAGRRRRYVAINGTVMKHLLTGAVVVVMMTGLASAQTFPRGPGTSTTTVATAVGKRPRRGAASMSTATRFRKGTSTARVSPAARKIARQSGPTRRAGGTNAPATTTHVLRRETIAAGRAHPQLGAPILPQPKAH